MHRPLLLLLSLTLAACSSAPVADSSPRPTGRSVIVLLDASSSMRENDPDRADLRGVDLTLSLLGPHDAVAVLSYDERPQVLIPFQAAGDTTELREDLRDDVPTVRRNGVTNLGVALAQARAIFEQTNAPPGATVIAVTDGLPTAQRPDRNDVLADLNLDAEVAALADRGWRLFAIALGQDAASPALNEVVARTGGSVVAVPTADSLVDAFERVAIEALGYLRAERPERGLRVPPHTRRLALIGRWSDEGRFGDLRREDQSVPLDRAIRSPADDTSALQVLVLPEPEPGLWSVTAEPAADKLVALLEPTFSLELDPDVPPTRVQSGATFAAHAVVRGDPNAIRELGNRFGVQARLERDGRPLNAWASMSRSDSSQPFSASFIAPSSTRPTSLTLVVEATLRQSGRTYRLRRTRGVTVLPEAVEAPDPSSRPLEVTVDPVDVRRAAWSDQDPAPIELRVVADPERPTTVTCEDVSRTLEPGAEATLRLPCPPRDATWVVRFEAALGEDSWSATQTVEVRVRRVPPPFPNGLTAPETPAGVPVSLPFQVPPGLTLTMAPLQGRGGEVPVTLGQRDLRFEPVPDLLPGRYAARFRFTHSELPDRYVPCAIDVLPPVPPPAPVRLDARGGWTSSSLDVAWPAGDEAPVEVSLTALRGPAGASLLPEFDLRWSPLDGWDGRALGPTPRRLALEAFVSSDLPAGDYTGSLELRRDGRTVRVPVTLEVRP